MLKIFPSENCDHPSCVLNQSKAPCMEHKPLGKEQPLSLLRECCTAKRRQHPQSLHTQHHCRTRGRLGHKLPANRTGKSGVQQPHAKSLKGCFWRKDRCCWQLGACRKDSWNQENGKKQSMNLIRSLIRDCLLHASCGLLDRCSASSPAAFTHGIRSSAKFQVQGHTFNIAFNQCPRDYSGITSPLQNSAFLTIIHK